MQLNKLAGFPVIRVTANSCTNLVHDKPQTEEQERHYCVSSSL